MAGSVSHCDVLRKWMVVREPDYEESWLPGSAVFDFSQVNGRILKF